MRAFIILCFLIPQFIGSSELKNDFINKTSKIDWEEWLPAIAMIESSNYPLAHSYLGPSYGRGLYGISEIALKEYKRLNPDQEWITPEMLYNPAIASNIAMWTLKRLEGNYQRNNPFSFALVLSSYWQGHTGTMRNGVAYEYVYLVMAAKHGW